MSPAADSFTQIVFYRGTRKCSTSSREDPPATGTTNYCWLLVLTNTPLGDSTRLVVVTRIYQSQQNKEDPC